MKESENIESNPLKRINAKYLIHEITHLLHLESGFLFTVKQLLLRPGKLVRSFIFEDRTKATKPLVFLIFSATVFTLIFHFFHIEYKFFSLEEKVANIDEYLEKRAISEWIKGHIGYALLLIGFLIALWIKVFFRKHHYNIYEITILLCYAMGQMLLILIIFSLLSYISEIKPLANVGVFAGYLYVIWAIGQFFGEKKWINYLKSAVCCVLGAMSLRLILIFLANLFYHLGIK